MFLCCFGRPATVESTYDPRYGAPNISAPNEGAFNSTNQNSADIIDVAIPVQPEPVHQPECGTETEKPSNSVPQTPASKHLSSTSNNSVRSGAGQASPPLNKSRMPNMPVHQAYISGGRESIRESVREGDSIRGTASNLSSPSASTHITTPITTPTTGGSSQTWPNLSPEFPQIQSKRASYNARVGLERTMKSEQPQTRPLIRLDPVPQKRAGKRQDATPESAQSVEQWPGAY